MVDLTVSDVRLQGLSGRMYASRGAAKSRAEGEAAPAFVLVHGIGVSHRYLFRLHRLLAETTDTYSIDLPGFGGTPKPGRRLSVGDYADFILAALDQVGVTSCVLVGHSMGVQFAVEAALRQPDRITELVLMGPVVDHRRRSVTRQALDLTTDCALFESASSNLIVLTDYLRCGPRWYLTELPVMMTYPLEERIGDVGVPVLVLRGAKDPVASRDWCQVLAARAAAGHFREVPGRGHVVQHTGTTAVARAILDFAGRPGRPLEATA
jgi:pimeloyl-ACP methyl ester carboxylesterase